MSGWGESRIGGSNAAAIDACMDEIQVLRDRLVVLDRRKAGLVRLRGRLGDFQQAQCSQMGAIRSGFSGVRFAGQLSQSLTETVTGLGFDTADTRLLAQLRDVSVESDSVQDQIEAVEHRVRVLRDEDGTNELWSNWYV